MGTVNSVNRRRFLAGASVAALGTTLSKAYAGDTRAAGVTVDRVYRTTRTDAEWMDLLGEDAFKILRGGETEFPFTSPYWENNDPGTYHCVGCQTPLYESDWYSPQEIGFVFFDHAIPNRVLLGIDITDYNGLLPEPKAFVEVHCEECGSHLGHQISLEGKILHCINGTALNLVEKEV